VTLELAINLLQYSTVTSTTQYCVDHSVCMHVCTNLVSSDKEGFALLMTVGERASTVRFVNLIVK
jgi:hypothetical protein